MTSTRAHLRRALLAAAFVALGAAAHRGASHPPVEVREVPIVTAPVGASSGRVAIALPDLAALRESTVVFRGRVENRSDARLDVEVRLNGFPQAAISLGPRGRSGFAFALGGGSARALTGGAGDHRLEVVGQPADWQLSTLDAATLRASLGSPAWVAIAPKDVPPVPPAARALAVVLLTFGAAAFAWGVGFGAPLLARVHGVLAGIAGAVLAAAALGPEVTSWRLLLATPLVWALVAVLFAPALMALGARIARVAVWLWRYDETTTERGAILVGVSSLVVALPIFEVVRGSPEFFVARNTSWATALGSAGILLFGAPGAVLLVECALRRISPAAATTYFLAAVGALAAALVHPWLTRAEVAAPWTMAGLAAASGVAVATIVWRVPGARRALAALAPAALVVPALFFGRAEVRESLAGWSSHVPAPTLARTPPIVVVIFDEFPLHSLLDAGERLDAERYPNFAALARDGSWYREATTVSSQTVWAVPAIASGRYPEAPRAVPTLRYYPGNLFTLLSGRYEMFVFGRFLQLCPEGACQRDLAGPADGPLQLATDLGVVWLHIVSPAPLADRLPPVVGDWRGFAATGRFRTVNGRRVRNDRLGELERFVETMTADPARLYFLHTLTPHMPFEYMPSGRRYEGPDYQGRQERGAGLFERVEPAYADALQQRHLMQVGFVDAMIGRLVARLRALGIYDESLIVVTADHGASYREGTPRRSARPHNQADILRVPLFIKRPGQREGGVVDGLVESIDILPTIADVLGARLPFQVDGRSLLAPEGRRPSRAFIERSFTRIRRREVAEFGPVTRESLARRIARFGVGPLARVYAVPGTEALLGRPVEGLVRGDAAFRISLTNLPGLASVDPASETLPLLIRGQLSDPVRPTLAVAVNGRIAATTMPFEERGGTWFSTLVPEEVLEGGANDVQVYVLERSAGGVALLAATR